MSVRELKDDITRLREAIGSESRYVDIKKLEQDCMDAYAQKMRNMRTNRVGIYAKAIRYDNIITESLCITGFASFFAILAIAFQSGVFMSLMIFVMVGCAIRIAVNTKTVQTIEKQNNPDYDRSPYAKDPDYVMIRMRLRKIADAYQKKQDFLREKGYYNAKTYSIAMGNSNTAEPAEPAPAEKK
jgi:hypothetical protein